MQEITDGFVPSRYEESSSVLKEQNRTNHPGRNAKLIT